MAMVLERYSPEGRAWSLFIIVVAHLLPREPKAVPK